MECYFFQLPLWNTCNISEQVPASRNYDRYGNSWTSLGAFSFNVNSVSAVCYTLFIKPLALFLKNIEAGKSCKIGDTEYLGFCFLQSNDNWSNIFQVFFLFHSDVIFSFSSLALFSVELQAIFSSFAYSQTLSPWETIC